MRIVGPSSGIVIRRWICHQLRAVDLGRLEQLVRDALEPGQEEEDGEARGTSRSARRTPCRGRRPGCRASPARGRRCRPTPSSVSTTPYCGWSSWSQTTPAITSDSTYGTKMMVRSRPWPRILRLSSSAIARPSGSCTRIDSTTMIMLCANASVKTSFVQHRRRSSAARRSRRAGRSPSSGTARTARARTIGQTTKTQEQRSVPARRRRGSRAPSAASPATARPAPPAAPAVRVHDRRAGGAGARLARSPRSVSDGHFSASAACLRLVDDVLRSSPCRRTSGRSRRSSRHRRTARRRCRSTAGRTAPRRGP